MKIVEIETAVGLIKTCPKCNSAVGFWFGMRGERLYVQCKNCGAEIEIFKVHKLEKEGSKSDFLFRS